MFLFIPLLTAGLGLYFASAATARHTPTASTPTMVLSATTIVVWACCSLFNATGYHAVGDAFAFVGLAGTVATGTTSAHRFRRTTPTRHTR